MGRAQVDGAVRYVSPVTARLFSRTGSEILGLSSGEVLAPMDASEWRDQHHHQASGPAPSLEPASYQACTESGGRGAMVRHRQVEVVRPCATPPANVGVTCPQAYLESILRERVSEMRDDRCCIIRTPNTDKSNAAGRCHGDQSRCRAVETSGQVATSGYARARRWCHADSSHIA